MIENSIIYRILNPKAYLAKQAKYIKKITKDMQNQIKYY